MGYRPRAQADGCLMRPARVDRGAVLFHVSGVPEASVSRRRSAATSALVSTRAPAALSGACRMR